MKPAQKAVPADRSLNSGGVPGRYGGNPAMGTRGQREGAKHHEELREGSNISSVGPGIG